MPVEVAIAQQDTVIDELLATGQIEAVQAIDLKPDIEGRLVSILAREGAIVSRGTPLFKIDDAELRALVAQLEAERDLADQALERTRDLLERNASSQADLEEAEANQRSTQAQLELQQVRLERTVVRAPFAGIVGERYVSIGDYVTTSTALTTLQTIDPQRAVFQVPERHANRLALGQTVRFQVAAVPDHDFVGEVDFVDPRVELPGRMITVKAKIPIQGANYVWVVEDGTASRREVELGVRVPGFVEVRGGGVAADTQVVVGGLERLSEGAPVMPMPPGGMAAGGAPGEQAPAGQELAEP
jgi:membrane fusion protein (multidrug efflux system)